MNCDQAKELLEAYVLGALDGDEQAAIEQHLATCGECRHLAAELADVVTLLPAAVSVASSARPTETLKSQILQAIETSAPPATPTDTTPENGTGPLKTLRSPLRRPGRWRIAAVLILGLSIGLGTGLSVTLAREQSLRAEIAGITGQQEIVLEVIDSPKTSKVLLRPPAGTPSNAYGKIYTRPDLTYVVAMAARLPQPTTGQAYHLWLTSQGQTKLVGILKVNAEGFGLLTFAAGQTGPVYEAALLTLQPIGSTSPDSNSIISWQRPN
jgi:anti-sigma-K factor RskA